MITLHCENCGSEIKAGNKFCESCGSKAAEVTVKSKSFSFKPVLIGLILLLFIGGAFAYFGGPLKPKAESSKVVCNPPYIIVGTDCCLDQNSNSICDKDEEKKQAEVTPKPIQQPQNTQYTDTSASEIPPLGTMRCSANNVPQRVELINGNRFWTSGPTCGENSPCSITEDGTAMCTPKHQCETLDKIECFSESSYRKCELQGITRVWVNHNVPPKIGNVVYSCESDKIIQRTICGKGVNLKIAEIDATPQVCYGGAGDSGYIELRLDNLDETNDIKGLSISIGGDKGTYKNDSINATIPVGLSTFLNLSYLYNTYGKIKNVEIIPKISEGSTIVSCNGSKLEIKASDMRNCTA